MRSRVKSLFLCALLVLVPLSTLPSPFASAAGDWNPDHIIISEILASPQGEDYGGVDLNGDGEISTDSDQFIELWNPTDEDIDISDWWLDDDPTGGSSPCSIGWNTTIESGARIAFFRDRTGLQLDYWSGDSVQLRTPDEVIVDTVTYPPEDSDYNYSYARDFANNGYLKKISPPTPGYEEGGEKPAEALDWGRCYTPNDNIHSGSYILTGRVVEMTAQEDVIPNGSILVKDGTIEAIWITGQTPLGVNLDGVPIHHTGATIYPGLIDMHNHLHYNTAPLWNMSTHLSTSQQSEWGGYTNRNQWKDHQDYKTEVSWVKTFLTGNDKWGMQSEALKYAEFKELVGGTTSAQGSPSSNKDGFDDILTRNIELYNFDRDHIKTCAVCDAGSKLDYNGDHLISDELLEGWFIHLSEGVDEESLNEFYILQQQNLLLQQAIIIHGVPFGADEFAEIAAVDASLVWSPTSNLLLYGDTAKVDLAKQAGVRITLAPDWSPSGTKSPLHELKVADLWDEDILGDVFSNYEMAQMVTSNAVDAMHWDGDVGRISPGLAADFVIIDSFDNDPYRNLIDAVDPDIRLTIVGGLAVYGDIDLMTAMNGNDWEYANITDWGGERTFPKALDATFLAVEDGAQTWAQITDNLEMAMRFDHDEMFAHFGSRYDGRADFDASFITGTYSDLSSVPLDPLYTWGDERYFEVLNYSISGNAQMDLSQLQPLWYAVPMDSEGNRAIKLDWGGGDEFENTSSGGATGGSGEGNQGWFCPFSQALCGQLNGECPGGENCTALIVEYCSVDGDGGQDCEDYLDECKLILWLGGESSLCQSVLTDSGTPSTDMCPFSNLSLCYDTSLCGDDVSACAGVIFARCDGLVNVADCQLVSAICASPNPIEINAFCTAYSLAGQEPDSGGEDWVNQPCSVGEVKAPDAEDCRYCVCTMKGEWTCDSGQCEDEVALEGKSGEDGGLGTFGMVGGAFLIVGLLIAILYLEKNRSQEEEEENEIGVDEKLGLDFTSEVDGDIRVSDDNSASEKKVISVPELPPIGPPPSSEE